MLKVPFFDPRLKQLNQAALHKAREFGKEIWEDGNFVPRAAFDAVLLEYLQEAGELSSVLVPTFYSDDLGYMISAEDRDLAVDKDDKEILVKFSKPVYQVTRDILYPNIVKRDITPAKEVTQQPDSSTASEAEAQQALENHLSEVKVLGRQELIGYIEAIWRFLYTKMGFRADGAGAGSLVVIAQAIKYIRDK